MKISINNFLIKYILDSIDIIDIISSRISLKKKGDYFFSICPFHKENIPSFSVNKNKKFYYCFGCKSYGNIINFLMNFHNITFIDTIIELSKSLNINYFIKSNNYFNKKYFYFYNKNEIICNIYKNNLIKYINSGFLNIYIKEKKWNINSIKNFSIGYSNFNMLDIYKKNNININTLLSIGIFYKKNDKYINMFSNRIIFPIHNIYGKIVAFGGRSINNFKPKYINSPENYFFKKRKILYGLYQVIKIYGKNIPKLLVVEGYTDVISLSNFGINYSVSILGSSLTIEHINILFKYTNNVIFCFDGDNVGFLSSVKSLKKILLYITDERKISFLFLKKNEDPDSIIRIIGKNNFELLISKSIDISQFILNIFFKKNLNYNNIYNKINILKKFTYLIKNIPSKLFKFFLKKQICNILNININEINYLLEYKKDIIYLNKNNLKFNCKYNPVCIGINLLIKNPELYKLINLPP